MTKPSIKNASTAGIEAAIARALAELTGWGICTATIQAKEYDTRLSSGEALTLTLSVSFARKDDPDGPF